MGDSRLDVLQVLTRAEMACLSPLRLFVHLFRRKNAFAAMVGSVIALGDNATFASRLPNLASDNIVGGICGSDFAKVAAA